MHTFRGPNLTNLYEKSTFFLELKMFYAKEKKKIPHNVLKHIYIQLF